MLGILATYNVKGGVGKTTTSVNLAWLAAREGFRTLLWDLDPQGGASYCLDLLDGPRTGSRRLVSGKVGLERSIWATATPNLHVLPAARSYRNMDLHLGELDLKRPDKRLLKLMRPLSKHYDLLFIDCAPSISLVSENIFEATDAVLVPTIPTTLSLRTYKQILGFFRKHNLDADKILPFFSMVDRRKTMHRSIVDTPPEYMKNLLQTAIPYDSKVEQMGIERTPLAEFAPNSRTAHCYEALWNDIKKRIPNMR